MKAHRRKFFILVLLAVLLASCRAADPEISAPGFDSNRLLGFGEGDFPGPEPEPFGDGWFRGGFHSAPVFSPDGNHMWWAGSWATQKVYVTHYEDGAWSEGEQISFSDEITSYRDPFISPDGKKFYFISTEPIPGVAGSGKENYWMAEWESGEWSLPRPLPAGVNQLSLHWTPSVDLNYDFYFSANIDGDPDIYRAEFKDGTYLDPVPLGLTVNSSEMEFTPHIAPDASYLLFSRVKDGNSPAHLYISFAQDGEWTEAVRVDNVDDCISPIVTPDQKYVIYLEGPTALAWRDTSFLEELRPE